MLSTKFFKHPLTVPLSTLHSSANTSIFSYKLCILPKLFLSCWAIVFIQYLIYLAQHLKISGVSFIVVELFNCHCRILNIESATQVNRGEPRLIFSFSVFVYAINKTNLPELLVLESFNLQNETYFLTHKTFPLNLTKTRRLAKIRLLLFLKRLWFLRRSNCNRWFYFLQ